MLPNSSEMSVIIMFVYLEIPRQKIWAGSWYFVTVRKNCSNDREKLLKLEAEFRNH